MTFGDITKIFFVVSIVGWILDRRFLVGDNIEDNTNNNCYIIHRMGFEGPMEN